MVDSTLSNLKSDQKKASEDRVQIETSNATIAEDLSSDSAKFEANLVKPSIQSEDSEAQRDRLRDDVSKRREARSDEKGPRKLKRRSKKTRAKALANDD